MLPDSLRRKSISSNGSGNTRWTWPCFPRWIISTMSAISGLSNDSKWRHIIMFPLVNELRSGLNIWEHFCAHHFSSGRYVPLFIRWLCYVHSQCTLSPFDESLAIILLASRPITRNIRCTSASDMKGGFFWSQVVAMWGIRPKRILNSNLAKSHSPRSYCLVVELFWNLPQSTKYHCSVQIFKAIWQVKWTFENGRYFARFEFKMRLGRIPYIATGPVS